jgi:predicted DNA-binding antitoxin AbrB/MazE fold protein
MPKTIRAVFENGIFRPTEPVDLPNACEVQIEILAQGPVGDAVRSRPAPTVTWDEISATKLVIGSAPPDENDDVELTGDDFLY